MDFTLQIVDELWPGGQGKRERKRGDGEPAMKPAKNKIFTIQQPTNLDSVARGNISFHSQL